MSAYELVEKWVKEEKRIIFPDDMFQNKDEKIALEILKQYYNAQYKESDDYNYCRGNWFIDNPYRKKVKGYKLNYSFKGSEIWETSYCLNILDFPEWYNEFAKNIIRLEEEKNSKKNEQNIAQFLKKNLCYLGKERFWEVIEIELYD